MVSDIGDLVPVPRRVERGKGSFDIRGRRWRIHPDLLSNTAVHWKLSEEMDVEVVPDSRLRAQALVVGSPVNSLAEPPEQAQGYALVVDPEGLVLCGRDVDGLYWGLVSLEQILRQSSQIPCARVHDWPVFRLRGHHDDVSRKQISRLSDFRRIIRLLSRYKINVYTPYMEDVLYLPSYPDIGEGRGRLTPSDVTAMHEEAARHNVTIMPTYSLIGHQENLLSDPKYAHLGRRVFQPMSSLDPAKAEVREFLRNVIRDVCELFPGPYFHAGFDETQGLGKEEFLTHANWCARQLGHHGKKMPMWVDMIYNHFGYEAIGRLADNIIPVNWSYHVTEGEVPHLRELCEQGRPVWGLAGYRNGCTLLPDFAASKGNIDAWARQGKEHGVEALFASQWGDNGYENHRDMCWNLFAYLGERAWSGGDARPADFERRFQLSFYGAELSELTEVIRDVPERLSMSAGDYWRTFRRNAFALTRLASDDRWSEDVVASDRETLEAALEGVRSAQRRAVREAEHLEHFKVALRRMLSVTNRQQFALEHANSLLKEASPVRPGSLTYPPEGSSGVSPERRPLSQQAAKGPGREKTRQQCKHLRAELKAVREVYLADWLRTNRWPNVEVSLKVYDDLLLSYELLHESDTTPDLQQDGYLLLDLGDVYNRQAMEVAGLPLGCRQCDGVPFLFADRNRTHVELGEEDLEVALSFPEQAIRDLHLVITGKKTADEPHPAAVVQLSSDAGECYSEELLSIRHLCDWWAPRGEHIWAGGGMAYVDPERVRFALQPGPMQGVARVFGFGVPAGFRASSLRIRVLSGESVQLFAATLELA